MNHLKALSVAVAAIGCFGSTAALTQTSYNPSWYLLPSVNVLDPENHFGVEKRGEGLGLRLGKPVAPYVDIQFGATMTRARDGGLRYGQNTLGADALFLFSRERFRPFVLAGAGAERDRFNAPNFAYKKTSPFIEGGAGFQYSVSDRFMVQADWRRTYGYMRDGESFGGSNRVNNNYLTLGVGYVFDVPRAPMIAQVTPRPAPVPVPAPAPTPPPPPPVAAPTPPPVVIPPPPPPAPRIERTTLSAEELFAFNRADIRQPQPKLDQMAAVLSSNPQITNVHVTGYTDRLGSNSYNLKLSQRRANAVKSYLVSKGVAPNRLIAVGKGESNPVVQCAQRKRSPALIRCLEPNRRVVVEQITVERRVS